MTKTAHKRGRIIVRVRVLTGTGVMAMRYFLTTTTTDREAKVKDIYRDLMIFSQFNIFVNIFNIYCENISNFTIINFPPIPFPFRFFFLKFFFDLAFLTMHKFQFILLNTKPMCRFFIYFNLKVTKVSMYLSLFQKKKQTSLLISCSPTLSHSLSTQFISNLLNYFNLKLCDILLMFQDTQQNEKNN